MLRKKTRTSKDIIVRVRGGLGNQLFIYAFSRFLSLKLKHSILLETHAGFIRDHYKRKYLLDKFNIQLMVCPWYSSLYYPLRHRFATITRLIFGNVTYIDDNEFYANPKQAILKINNSKKTYLDGYWQDSTYFADYEDIIRKDLTLKKAVDAQNLTIGLDMSHCNSVAIHVRRVKYSTVLELEYYIKAIHQIKARISNPVFYVFSDDLTWCRQNLISNDSFIFVDNKSNDEIIDIWLMSQCKHFIIANSTFSWWGAWLSNNPEKIIITSELENP